MAFYNHLKIDYAVKAATADGAASAAPPSESESVKGLLDMLTANKGAGETFQYFKQNQADIHKLLKFLGDKPDGLASVLDIGATDEGMASLTAKLPDKASQDALKFLVKNREQIKSLQKVIHDSPWAINPAVDFMANYAKPLEDMAKFAAEHPKEAAQLANLAFKGGPSSSFGSLIKDPSFEGFAKNHPLEMVKIGYFVLRHGHELPAPRSGAAKPLQELGVFALSNKDQVTMLMHNISSLQTGLKSDIEPTQKEADARQEAIERDERHTREATIKYAITLERSAYLRKIDPNMYIEAMELQRKAIVLARGLTSEGKALIINPENKAKLIAWQESEMNFYARLQKAHPEYKVIETRKEGVVHREQEQASPILHPYDFAYNPKLIAPIEQTLNMGNGVKPSSTPPTTKVIATPKHQQPSSLTNVM